MTNPIIETDLAEILREIRGDQKKILSEISDLKVGQAELTGQIKAVDERLSGQIKALDEKLSGEIKAVDTKVDQIEKRIGNQEFLNRGIFAALLLIALGGAIKFFGFIPSNQKVLQFITVQGVSKLTTNN